MKFTPPLDISNFLPHKAPLLMVDKISSMDNEHVSTFFKIEEHCIFVEDNVLNEYGLVENAAQTCSSIVGQSFFEKDDLEGKGAKLVGFISAIKKIKIVNCPSVGSVIISEANLKSRFDTDEYSLCSIICNSYENEKLLLTCEINLLIKEVE